MLLSRLWRWQTTQDSEKPNSSETLWVLHNGLVHSLGIYSFRGLPDLVWSSKVLQPEWNDLSHLWSTGLTPFSLQFFLGSSSLKSMSFWIRLCCTFIFEAFKSFMLWSSLQCINSLTTALLPIPADTFHSFNCCVHMIYSLQICSY